MSRKRRRGTNRARKRQRRKLYRSSGGRCAYCRKFITYEDMTLDHAVPSCRGGTNEMINFRVCCYECNQEKDYMNEREFVAYRRIRLAQQAI